MHSVYTVTLTALEIERLKAALTIAWTEGGMPQRDAEDLIRILDAALEKEEGRK